MTTNTFDKDLKDITDDMNHMLVEDHTEYSVSCNESCCNSSHNESSCDESDNMDIDDDVNASYTIQSLFFNKNWIIIRNDNPTLSNKEIYNKVMELWNKNK